jgi:hypothetical protein
MKLHISQDLAFYAQLKNFETFEDLLGEFTKLKKKCKKQVGKIFEIQYENLKLNFDEAKFRNQPIEKHFELVSQILCNLELIRLGCLN